MAAAVFNGTDPVPTLAQFQQLVADGRIRYFIGGIGIGGGAGGARGPVSASTGSGDAQLIADWVAQTFAAQTVDGVTLDDLAS